MEITNLEKNFQAVQRYINSGQWGDASSASTQLRIMGEYIAKFYVSKLHLENKVQAKLKKSINDEYMANFLTLREEPSKTFEKDFKQDLILFLELSKKFGNRSAHDSDEIAIYKVKFVAFFYKEYVKAQFEKDYKNWIKKIFKDVTETFSKKTISIFSRASAHFAGAYDDVDGKPVRCNIKIQRAWEIFYVKNDMSGWATFQSNTESKLYLMANIEQDNAPVLANSPNTQKWERFKIYHNQIEDFYCIKAQANEKWLVCCMDDAPDYPLQASGNGEFPDDWGKFEINIC